MPSLEAWQATFQEWDSSRPQYLAKLHVGQEKGQGQQSDGQGVI